MTSSCDRLRRALLSCLSLGHPTLKAGFLESPDPRDGAEGTEEALHTKEAREGD